MSQRAQISATTFIFFMILSLVVAGYVIRTFLVPAVTSFEQGALVKSIANVKGAYTAVCEGRSVGQQFSISVPAKGVFLVQSCPELVNVVTEIVPINGAGKLPDETVAELKGKCPTDTDLQKKTVLLAYGWDRSWDWWFIHKENIEIKSELIGCGKPVSAMLALGQGDYQRQLRLERDKDDNEMVKLT